MRPVRLEPPLASKSTAGAPNLCDTGVPPTRVPCEHGVDWSRFWHGSRCEKGTEGGDVEAECAAGKVRRVPGRGRISVQLPAQEARGKYTYRTLDPDLGKMQSRVAVCHKVLRNDVGIRGATAAKCDRASQVSLRGFIGRTGLTYRRY